MQTVPAAPHHGTRLRLTAYVKTQGVDDWAALWMRVDSADEAKPLAFDNMADRPINGTTD